jgi:hypothetical protein
VDDGLAHARSQSEHFQEAVIRLGSAFRRWTESADGARSAWDDGAGRTVFQRFLDPHRQLIESTTPVIARALESQEGALGRAGEAGEHAIRASDAAARAHAEAGSARRQADNARAEASTAQAELTRARTLAGSVSQRVASLGG